MSTSIFFLGAKGCTDDTCYYCTKWYKNKPYDQAKHEDQKIVEFGNLYAGEWKEYCKNDSGEYCKNNNFNDNHKKVKYDPQKHYNRFERLFTKKYVPTKTV